MKFRGGFLPLSIPLIFYGIHILACLSPRMIRVFILQVPFQIYYRPKQIHRQRCQFYFYCLSSDFIHEHEFLVHYYGPIEMFRMRILINSIWICLIFLIIVFTEDNALKPRRIDKAIKANKRHSLIRNFSRFGLIACLVHVVVLY